MSNVLNMVSEQKFEAQTDKIAAAITAAGDGTVDTAMSDSSTNAVQNKVIKAYVDAQSGGGATVIPLILTESGLTSETTYKEAFDASLQGVVIFTYGLGDSQARVALNYAQKFVQESERGIMEETYSLEIQLELGGEPKVFQGTANDKIGLRQLTAKKQENEEGKDDSRYY